jgi:hypothetical protein
MSIVSMLGDNPESVLFSKLNADQKRIIATNLFASIFGPFEGREDGPALKHFAVFEKETDSRYRIGGVGHASQNQAP